MAKVAYVNPTPDLKDGFSALFTPVYKTKNSSLRFTGGIIPARKRSTISTRSLLPQIAETWKALDTTTQNAWKAAGAAQNMPGYSLFVQDTAYRLKNDIAGLATPSTLHGYKVGEIIMADPATNFRLEQLHPVQYFQMKKVRGTKSQREPVAIIEQLLLPLTIGISYRTNLTSNGSNPYAKFYAEVTRSYQSLDLVETLEVPLSLSSDWARDTATLSDVVGLARWYSLYIELNDVLGTIQFDLVQAEHTGTNYARDFRCTNISAGFSDYNYQIPASWAADVAVTGASFGSVYPSDDPL